MSSDSASSEVDAAIWRALAGSHVQIPNRNSSVYYFPQGHLEHYSNSASPTPTASPTDTATAITTATQTLKRPFFPCQVISVGFHCNLISDQAFVRILLQPAANQCGSRINIANDFVENDVVSFSKVLTPSDANNGGGFSVPRFCADSIFPRLNFAADPPVQNLIMKDTHNNAWEFRHIYRGTPRRHLLTTGWSRFVNAKRLVSGDSVVFMRKRSTSELFIGVRRGARFGGANGWDSESGTEAAIKAMENAGRGYAFEVIYYPRAGLPDFVVSTEKVDNAMKIYWSPGMQVRMPLETDDFSRITWFSGIISVVGPPVSGPWSGSPWRMLQVTWEEPVLESMNRVSPWQVERFRSREVIPASPPPLFPPFKRLRAQEMMMPPNGTGVVFGSTSRHPNSGALINYPSSSSPVNCFKSLSELLNTNAGPHLRTVSTVLNIGTSRSENLSPCGQGSVHLADQQNGHRLMSSIQLFGKTIQTNEPVEGGGGSKSNASCREDELYKETNVLNNQPSPSV
ncbi:hypothetical protein ACJIZ3_024551 [Penstemon smallii]|uniref:Auxin response factor n=1 Tax=Penstemon smallii TaxID=265156 RepID=A0ABD3TSF8_9LAMI